MTSSTPKPTAIQGGAGISEAPPPRLAPGALVAERYRIVNFIDEGGMGAVYRVEHEHMRKAFALKVLHRTMVNRPEIVARFEREAVAAGSIGHPNVAAATDFGQLPDGSFFLILELVQGRNLRDELRAGALEPSRAMAIVRGIVAGVGAAHARGIVHRDLKPENVMLVEHDGNPDFVKVLDFGIAKLDAQPGAGAGASDAVATPLTRIGTVIGTPEYMSPEQSLGNPIDARSDLYSIGVIFHELLSGQCPFEGDAVRLLQQHVLGEVPALPPEVASKLDPRLPGIVSRLLAKDPAERFATATELGMALSELAAPARVVIPAPVDVPGAVPRSNPPASLQAHSLPGHSLPGSERLRQLAKSEPMRRLAKSLTTAVAEVPPALRIGLLTALAILVIAIAVRWSRGPDAGGRAGSADGTDGHGAASHSSAGSSRTSAAGPTASSPLDLPPAPDPTADPDAPPARRNADGHAADSHSADGHGADGSGTGPAASSHRRTGPGGIYIPPPRDWFK